MVADGRYKKGSETVMVVDGEEYILPPFEEADFDAIEAYLKEQQRPALEALGGAGEKFEKLPAALREGLIDRVYRDLRKGAAIDVVSRTTVMEWLDTTDGVVYSIYLQLKKRYPDMTIEKAKRIVTRVGIAEAIRKRDEASDDLRNLTDAANASKEIGTPSIPETPAEPGK